MNERLELSDAAIEAMLARRARRADAADLAEVALDAVRRTRPGSGRPWVGLAASPRLASGSTRWVWVAIAAMLALALVGGLLAGGASRLLHRPYPVLTGGPPLLLSTLAVSGDELWTIAPAYIRPNTNIGERGYEVAETMAIWHYVGDAWQGPLSAPPLGGETPGRLALGPDGALWVSSDTRVAVLRDGGWRLAWKAPADASWLSGLVVSGDGTAWVSHGRHLVGLRRDDSGYAARSVECPSQIHRIAATTDGAVYVGGWWYSGGEGLARSDGVTCAFVDPIGDRQVHEVADLSAGPAGTLLATVIDERGGCCRVWAVTLRDGRWSTIFGPTDDTRVNFLAIAPDGHLWGLEPDLGLQRHEDGAWRVVEASAHSLVMAPDGVLWYETDRGLERIRTGEVGG